MLTTNLNDVKYCHVPIEKGKSFFFDQVHIFWNEQVSFHQHAEWELSYIITGSGTRIVGDIAETFSRGEIVLLPPNMPHCWSFNESDHDEHGKIQNVTICFPASLFQKCLDAFPELETSIARITQYDEAIKFEGETLQVLQRIFTEMPKQNDLHRLTSLINMFSVIAASHETKVVGYSKQQHRSAARMREVHRFILNNYQQHISLDAIATHLGMNRSSLCVFFKRVQGKSLFTYLNEFRVESSCLMLRETNMSIAEICHAVGFNDIPYYNRTFKKMKGITPKSYRAQHIKM